VLATCWAGCDRLDVLRELRTRGLLGAQAREYRPHAAALPRRDDDASDAARTASARAILRETVAAPQIIGRYLARRGIMLDAVPACLRLHPRCPRPDGSPTGAMVAPVEHVIRGITGIHRTYLTPDGFRPDRATLGPIGGGAVRFGMPRPGEWFAVAEGIETTLAVVSACAMPGWAALSASGIRARERAMSVPLSTGVGRAAREERQRVGQLRTGAGISTRSLTCPHEINDHITKLREQAGKPPFDDGVPPERNTGFLIIKHLMISE
jgi:hypothetical protein